MRVLGIETSCDETAAAVVEDGKRLLSNVVASSMDLHAVYGGVVPEIAARSHIEHIMPVIEQALTEAKTDWNGVDAIAVTYGAGLGGSLLVGVLTARTLSIIKKKPLYGCNHVIGHVFVNFLTETSLPAYQLPAHQPQFPMLGLIVSGGHTQMALWRDYFDYTLLGRTKDDAIGEAFDKVAKLLGLPYPGGPSVGKAAKKGDSDAIKLPKAQMRSVSPELLHLRQQADASGHTGGVVGSAGKQTGVARDVSYDFSFSGLKTAVLRAAQSQIGMPYDFPSHQLPQRLSEAQKANIAASFQKIAIETVVDKVAAAFIEFQPKSLVIGGGVAASPELRRQLSDRIPLPVKYTDPKLCTDNGAMIAALGHYMAIKNQPPADPYKLEINPDLSM